MSKGLEALRRIDKHLPRHEETQEKEFSEYVSIIEKELKDLDTIKEIFSQYGLAYKLTLVREALLLLKQYQGSYGVRGQALITKKLKTLEIIKEKKVNICCFCEYNVDTYKDYIATFEKVNLGKKLLTEEEYGLLKEVLK